MRVLMTGGTGVIGSPVVSGLLERGHTVRLFSRGAERDAQAFAGRVEIHPGSISDGDAVRGAAEECDAVLHIAGIVSEDPPEITFRKVNVEGTANLLREAERAGVTRFIYISSLGADRGASDYHRSKHEAEGLVQAFPGSWLILRPGNVYGPGDAVISTLLQMVRVLPAIPTIGAGDDPFQPIYASDLASAIIAALEEPGFERQILELAGAEVTTMNGLLEVMAEITGKDPPRFPLPNKVLEAGAVLAGSLGIDLPISHDVLTMLQEENVIGSGGRNALIDLFGIQPTPLRIGLERLAEALPERLPSQGVGSLDRHRYWADIRGARMQADELFSIVCREFGQLAPEQLLRVDPEGRGSADLVEGETLALAIPLRGTIQVRVEEVAERAATSVTLEGHPLSGMIRFLVREPEPGTLRFEVRSYFRGSNQIDRAIMSSVGGALQGATWRSMVEAVVARSGGQIVDGVHADQQPLSDEEARHVENWVEELVLRRKREGR